MNKMLRVGLFSVFYSISLFVLVDLPAAEQTNS